MKKLNKDEILGFLRNTRIHDQPGAWQHFCNNGRIIEGTLSDLSRGRQNWRLVIKYDTLGWSLEEFMNVTVI